MTRELLQQALDALKVSAWDHIHAVGKQALIDAIIDRLAQPEPEKRIVWCTETDSACSTCPTLRIPCQAATQAAALNARVTVPREPTQEMIAAGEAVFRSYCFRHVNGAIPTYEAMIAAAPAPAVPADAAMTLLKELRHALEPISAYGRVGTRDVEQAKLQHLVAMIDRVLSAAPAVPQEPIYGKYTADDLVRGVLQSAAPAVPANKMGQGRLILEAASGMHGDVDKQLTAIYTDWLNSLAAPAVREPLTDEQIDALWRAPMSADWEHREFARAIEAHHGIGGGGNG